jgi:hypothetical protein
MKTRRLPLLVGIVLLLSLAFVGVASACEFGCTPGFWKNHPDAWPEPELQLPCHDFDLNGDDVIDTPMDMLNYKGGSGIEGAQRIVLRAYVASKLNKATWSDFPIDEVTFINAIHSGDREWILHVAGEMDGFNNALCELN